MVTQARFLVGVASEKDDTRRGVSNSRCESATFDFVKTDVNGLVAMEITEKLPEWETDSGESQGYHDTGGIRLPRDALLRRECELLGFSRVVATSASCFICAFSA